MEQPTNLNPTDSPDGIVEAKGDSTDQLRRSPPRAFAQGTGVLLQTVGVILFLSTCCVYPLAGMWEPLLSRPQILQHLQDSRSIGVTVQSLPQHPFRTGVMLMVMCMTVGGLAMAGFGLGLQAEKPRSAWAALVTMFLVTVVLMVAGVGIWSGQGSLWIRLWHTVLTVITVLLTGFTWIALKQMRTEPPPPNADVLPEDFKIPYSHYHDDPPEVRLARQLADRRARLEAEQRQLERLENELDAKYRNP